MQGLALRHGHVSQPMTVLTQLRLQSAAGIRGSVKRHGQGSQSAMLSFDEPDTYNWIQKCTFGQQATCNGHQGHAVLTQSSMPGCSRYCSDFAKLTAARTGNIDGCLQQSSLCMVEGRVASMGCCEMASLSLPACWRSRNCQTSS